jgi:hypothetical protein
MSTLDEITKEKQRLGEAPARVDAQRERLTGQLSKLEATEGVLARYSKGMQAKRTPMATKAAAAARPPGRRRITTAKPAGDKRTSPTLGDQVLALANGETQQEIAAARKGLARIMSAPPLPGTNGPAASKSATGSSTRRSRRRLVHSSCYFRLNSGREALGYRAPEASSSGW